MATGKKVTPPTRPKAPRRTNPPGPPEAEAARKPEVSSVVCKHCGMGDPSRDRVAEFLALSVREKAHDLLQHPAEWLDWPNPNLGGRKPNDLIGTDEEFRVHNILNCASLGMF